MPDAALHARKGRILEIQRFSIHDGPGIRTTVFLKGCPLRCIWCHNPDAASSDRMLSFLPGRCIVCGYCVRICPRQAHRIEAGLHTLDRTVCDVCGSCTDECHAKALELIGRDMSAGEVMEEVVRDRPFYETSGGGITLSGGEPTFQMDFTEALLRLAREQGLHTCLETCGHTHFHDFETVMPLVDLFLYDIKETDPERHREYTGVSNEIILANLRALHAHGASILLRCPLVPGYNNRTDHFEALAALATELPNLIGIELMPYHPLGEDKLQRLGLDGEPRAASQPPTDGDLANWLAFLQDRGAHVVNDAHGAEAYAKNETKGLAAREEKSEQRR